MLNENQSLQIKTLLLKTLKPTLKPTLELTANIFLNFMFNPVVENSKKKIITINFVF